MADRDQTETSPGAESVGQEAGPGAFTGRRALSKSANDAGGTLHAVAAGNTTALTQLLGVSAIVDQAALERQVMAQADRMLTANEQAKERRRLDRTTTQIRRLEDHIAKALDRIERSRTVDQQSTHEKTLAKYETELSTVLADKQAIELRLQGLEAPSDGGQPLGPSSSGRAIESRRDRLIRTGKITPFASVDEEAPPATQPEWADAEDQRLAASRASVSSPEISLQGAAQPSMPSEDPATDAVHKDDGDELFYQTRLDKWAQQRHHLRQRVHPTCTDSSEPVERLTTSAADEPFLPHPSIPDLVISKRFRIPGDIHHRLFDYQKTCLRWLWELHTQKAGGIIGDEMGLGKTVQLIAFLGGMYYSQLLRGTRRHFHNQGDSSAAPPSVLLPSLIVCPATIMKQWVCEFHQWWPPLKVSVLHATGSARLYGSDQPPSSATGRPGGKRRRQRASGRGSDMSEPDDSDWEQPLFDTTDNREKLQPASKHRRMAPASKRTADARSSAPAATPSPWAHSLIDRVFASGGHVLVTTYAGMRLYRQKLLSKRWGYVVLDEGHQIRNPDAEITLVCKQVKTSHRIILSGTPIQNNLTELWSLFDFVFPGRLGTLPVFQEQFSTPISLGGFANANNYQVQTAYKCACVLRDLIDPYLLRRLKADVACDLPDKQEQVLFCSLTPAQRRVYQEFLNSGEMESILEGRRQMLYGIDIVRKICNHPDLLMLPKSGIDPAAQFDEAADGRHRCGPETSKAATNKVDDFNRRRHHPRSRSASAQQTATAASGAFLAPSRHLPLHKVTDPQFGAVERSGKMLVVQMLLKMWAPQGHRALLFSQTRQMLDLLERMVQGITVPTPGAMDHGAGTSNAAGPNDSKGLCEPLRYLRMDGTTPIHRRAQMIDAFNRDKTQFLFLLTTKVGGLGTNLTGADRVIIFDPDWNPSTDMQARERAWRLGQTRAVTIYRLMTAGTIEEKIYHRQIFKQFLTSKILKDPKQKRFFKANDLRDLFTLGKDDESGDDDGGGTETGAIFEGTEVRNCRTVNQDGSSASPCHHGALTSSRSRQATPSRHEADAIRQTAQVAKVEPLREDHGPRGSPSHRSTAERHDQQGTIDQGEPGRDPVLSQLFEMTGIRAAVQHDAIMDSPRQEEVLVEQEAMRIAKDAANALRASREARRRMDVSVPTWTGSSGQAGAPRRFGSPAYLPAAASPALPSTAAARPPGSAQLLSRLQQPGAAPPSAPTSIQSSQTLLANLRARQAMESATPTPAASPATSHARAPVVVSNKATGTSAQDDLRHLLPAPSLRHPRPATGGQGTWRRQGLATMPSGPGASPRLCNQPASDALLPMLTPAATNPNTTALSVLQEPPEATIHKMRDYLCAVGGRATSGEIVAHFKLKVKSNQVVLFRKMLKEIATFESVPGSRDKGAWVLKLEYA